MVLYNAVKTRLGAILINICQLSLTKNLKCYCPCRFGCVFALIHSPTFLPVCMFYTALLIQLHQSVSNKREWQLIKKEVPETTFPFISLQVIAKKLYALRICMKVNYTSVIGLTFWYDMFLLLWLTLSVLKHFSINIQQVFAIGGLGNLETIYSYILIWRTMDLVLKPIEIYPIVYSEFSLKQYLVTIIRLLILLFYKVFQVHKNFQLSSFKSIMFLNTCSLVGTGMVFSYIFCSSTEL